MLWRYRMYSPGSKQDPVSDSCEHSNEPSGSIKTQNVLPSTEKTSYLKWVS
jgi:hypothetical protein